MTESKRGSARALRVVAACIVMSGIGFIYGWSVFSAPLQKEFMWDPTVLAFTFTVLMWAFCCGGMLGAKLTAKTSPRVTLIVSALGIFASFTLTALLLTQEFPWIMYGTYSVLGGLCVGMAYTTTMASALAWYPDKTGTISGVLLLFNSTSTLFLGSLAAWLFSMMNWRSAFMLISAVIGCMVICMSFALRKPTSSEEENLPHIKDASRDIRSVESVSSKQMVRTPQFWAFSFWMLLVCSVGLGVLGTTNQLMQESGAGVALAVLLVGVCAICNGAGRLIGGIAFDNLGLSVTMYWVTAFHVVGCALIVLGIATSTILFSLCGIIIGGIGIGASSVVGSGFAATIFGGEHYGENLAILNLNLMPAALIGPVLLSISMSQSHSYEYGMMALVVFGVIALLASVITQRAVRSRSQS